MSPTLTSSPCSKAIVKPAALSRAGSETGALAGAWADCALGGEVGRASGGEVGCASGGEVGCASGGEVGCASGGEVGCALGGEVGCASGGDHEISPDDAANPVAESGDPRVDAGKFHLAAMNPDADYANLAPVVRIDLAHQRTAAVALTGVPASFGQAGAQDPRVDHHPLDALLHFGAFLDIDERDRRLAQFRRLKVRGVHLLLRHPVDPDGISLRVLLLLEPPCPTPAYHRDGTVGSFNRLVPGQLQRDSRVGKRLGELEQRDIVCVTFRIILFMHDDSRYFSLQ